MVKVGGEAYRRPKSKAYKGLCKGILTLKTALTQNLFFRYLNMLVMLLLLLTTEILLTSRLVHPRWYRIGLPSPVIKGMLKRMWFEYLMTIS